MVGAWVLDALLVALFVTVVAWAVHKGFFPSALQLLAWVASVAIAGALSSALAGPIYEAFAARPVRRTIEASLDNAVNSSQAAQAARQVISDLPEALTALASRFGGIETDQLVSNLDKNQFNAANAAELLETSIVAPIGTAVVRVILSLIVFTLLLTATRLIVRKVAKLRKLPVLKQADRILGAVLGLVKASLLLFVVSLALQAAAAMEWGGPDFAQSVETSRCIALFSWGLHV